jgi:hypothetical protein
MGIIIQQTPVSRHGHHAALDVVGYRHTHKSSLIAQQSQIKLLADAVMFLEDAKPIPRCNGRLAYGGCGWRC